MKRAKRAKMCQLFIEFVAHKAFILAMFFLNYKLALTYIKTVTKYNLLSESYFRFKTILE